jgi:hypothetical protein
MSLASSYLEIKKIYLLGLLFIGIITTYYHGISIYSIQIIIFYILISYYLLNRVNNGIDKQLLILSLLFNLIIMIILNIIWTRVLYESGNARQGFDPIRYYHLIPEFIENGYELTVGLNFLGVIYYGTLISELFGHSSITISLINTAITFLSIYFLINFLIESTNKKYHKYSYALFFIPEILWYQNLLSKEILICKQETKTIRHYK